MTLSVIVNGAQGKMGSLAVKTLEAHPDFHLVAGLGKQDDLAAAIQKTGAKIVVDLTTAASVYTNSLIIIENNAHPVIGSSGLQDAQIQELRGLCEDKSLGGIIVPNFSIGAVLMMHFAKQAAAFLPETEIIESHHEKKLDAPSGTALKTAELIVQARKQARQVLPLKEIIPAVRGGCYEDINIHSIRLPGFLAKQEVIFGNVGETLTISHNSIDRACFMPGVVLACQQVSSLNSLYYGLEHLLHLF